MSVCTDLCVRNCSIDVWAVRVLDMASLALTTSSLSMYANRIKNAGWSCDKGDGRVIISCFNGDGTNAEHLDDAAAIMKLVVVIVV
mmetsp:Transcript_27869/g.32992  ORF Transcript_27869/g.32992 Transcript_27869/m.32992 type:complete len:86 (+) Transcript_27869:1245-1502(+)